MLLYSDLNGKYRLVDYDASHSQLLIRKHKHKEVTINIDIIFKAVFSLNISIIYQGLEIYVEKRVDSNTNSNPANRKFIIKLVDGEGIISYIDCGAFGIFKNSFEYSQSSLGDTIISADNKPDFWLTDKDFLKYIASADHEEV